VASRAWLAGISPSPHLALVVTPNLIESGVEFIFLAGDGNKVDTFLRTMGLFYRIPNSLVWTLT
jgi:hypothetical protein